MRTSIILEMAEWFYNEGFWGFHVDSTKRYIASLYIRGNYSGLVNCYLQSNTAGDQLAYTTMDVDQTQPGEWRQFCSPTFMPVMSSSDANSTFHFTFDGSQLAGQSMYFNLLSVFKQTYKNRVNGLREDLAESVENLKAKWIRLPGGNNMEGTSSPYYWKWNETIGGLKNRPGRPGTWGDINTDGFGLLEMLQMSQDMGLKTVLGIWAGLYLDGEVVSEQSLQHYVVSAMNELEFLTGDAGTTYGAQRAALGYPDPFAIDHVEIGNEDYLNDGTISYNTYRFMDFYKPILEEYPSIVAISTINPSPAGVGGSAIDLHIYENEATFADLFNTFDQASRDFPVFVAEYAAIRPGSSTSGQVGAQTFGMACAEAIFLLGCERNSDVVVGSAYGALIKSYNEEPGSVAVIKHMANEILLLMSYYVQKLFAENMGSETLPVTATDGGFGPIYWSATENTTSTILKLVNYGGQTGTENAVNVTVFGSSKEEATLIVLSAPNSTSVNNLLALGGEASEVSVTTVTGSNGQFMVAFGNAFEIAILVI
ncbi:Alpha-L-arabinofuranosidase A [Pleurostoma richardsiae]|uniref:non-reducing end alpha-L-arabinofuranosidase n=1 Tax=Pleurostoma richardsiae TaxID=41990 RepID=A0AA38VKI0_9PEZI|nr:Alpha-L-arabinofuranosidase A [Pleurostoma richardsiae]